MYHGPSAGSGNLLIIQFVLDTLRVSFDGLVAKSIQTSAVYRDPSAWYHIVFSYDSTQAISSNRAKLYVNGLQITAFSTAVYPDLDQQFQAGINNIQIVGSSYSGAPNPFDGYLTEVNFIDGQALTPSSFGQIESTTGVWSPKQYVGTYGTNGFYLKFGNTSSVAALGNDSSGNNNTFTVNNVSLTAGVTYDSMLDVPVNYSDSGNGRGNYCVLSPISRFSTGGTLSNANLTCALLGSVGNNKPTFGASSGKWYAEFTISSLSGQVVDVALVSSSPDLNTTKLNAVYCSNGQTYNYGSSTYVAYGAGWVAGDVIAVAWDLDVNQVTFYRNGASQGTLSTPLVGISASGGDVSFTINNSSTQNITFSANFGQRPFSYTPPTGFRALNTNNLPTPTIVNGANFMAATTYTGNAAARSLSNAVNNVSFQPDLVWIKSRTPGATSHALFDSVRGTTKYLSSDTTAAETTNANTLTAFGANGFSLGTDTTLVNANANSYIAWQWRESITAGLDVVSYAGTGVNRTVAHNLGVAPAMIIVKRSQTGGTGNWQVRHTSIAAANSIQLNSTAAAAAAATVWNSTAPTSSVFSLGTDTDVNASGISYIAYCFAEIAGYSKFGSYAGNNSADGPFVFCGFRPRWVMIKATVSGYQWRIIDTSRNSFNLSDLEIYPSSAQAENNAAGKIDITSNGFKIRTGAGSGINDLEQYIFAAFAEVPTKYALAR